MSSSAVGQPIQMRNGSLAVPDRPIVPFIEGDGTGPDIWRASQRVFDAAVAKAYGGKRQIAWQEVLAGQKSFDKTGNWLPDETLDAFRELRVGIKGPLTTPVGGGIRSLNVALRQLLDLYVCLRPVRYFPGVPTPVKQPELVDMVIFRENTEDIYAGIEFAGGTQECQKILDFLGREFPKEAGKVRFGTKEKIDGLAEAARDDRRAASRTACRGRHRHQTDELPRHRAAGTQRDRLRDSEQAEERDARPQGQHHEVHRRRLPRLGLPRGPRDVRRRGNRRRPLVPHPGRKARRGPRHQRRDRRRVPAADPHAASRVRCGGHAEPQRRLH